MSELELEIKTSRIELINVSRGGACKGVRVSWRSAGERRWQHFNLVPDELQTLDELEANAGRAVELVRAGKVREPGDRRLRNGDVAGDAA